MKTQKILKICLGAFILLSVSCKKYPEGPGVSLTSKKARMANLWTIEKYVTKSGTEYKEVVFDSNLNDTIGFVLDLDKDGGLEYHFGGSHGLENIKGKWEFFNNKTELKIISGTESEEFLIRKLKNKQLTIEDSVGNVTYFTAVTKG